jgi:hypothetical protein
MLMKHWGLLKMALTDKLSAIGDAIREKTGKEELIKLDDMPAEIASITTGGGDVVDTTVEDGFLDNSLTGVYTNNRIKVLEAHRLRGSKLTAFNSTSLETVYSYGFYQSANLEEINAPNINSLTSGSAFMYCYALKRVDFPKLRNAISGSVFNACTSLIYANLGNANALVTGCFSGCSKLETVILNKIDGIATLNNVNVFNGTPIANGTGFVYVPDELVDSYKVATNWSTYAAQIKPLSELPEEVK